MIDALLQAHPARVPQNPSYVKLARLGLPTFRNHLKEMTRTAHPGKDADCQNTYVCVVAPRMLLLRWALPLLVDLAGQRELRQMSAQPPWLWSLQGGWTLERR